MKERNKATPAVYLILRKGDEVLLGLRQNTGYFDGYWNLPSGHVEAGELPREALVREVKEEIGVSINPAKLQFAHAMYTATDDNTGERCDYFFVLTDRRGEPVNLEPTKCVELKWFPLRGLPPNTIQKNRLGVEGYLNGVPRGTFSNLQRSNLCYLR